MSEVPCLPRGSAEGRSVLSQTGPDSTASLSPPDSSHETKAGHNITVLCARDVRSRDAPGGGILCLTSSALRPGGWEAMGKDCGGGGVVPGWEPPCVG